MLDRKMQGMSNGPAARLCGCDGRIFGETVRYGIFGVAMWLVLNATTAFSQTGGPIINLLDPKNGGQVLVETSDNWAQMIDGTETSKKFDENEWGVFAFKDERTATFDTFAVLIPSQGSNLEDFELLAGNDSPTGKFDSIGKFTTTNAKMVKNPYQEFRFSPVTAKYLKVVLINHWGGGWLIVYQFRLFGRLNP